MSSSLRLRLAALRGLRADLAALLLGALAAVALPPFHAIPVLLVSVPGLLVLLDAANSVWEAARRGWWFGLGHHVLGLYWITEAILFEAGRFWWLVPLAVPAVAAALALFIAAACLFTRLAAPGWPRVVTLAGAWALTDLARQFVLTGFPWNPWGSVWEVPGLVGDVLIQPAALIGVHGLTMATVFLAGLPILSRRWWLAGGIMMIAWVAFGVVRLQEVAPPQPLTVVLEQGNVAQGQKFDQALASRIFQNYLALSPQGGMDRPAVEVWPETAFPGLLDLDERARQVIEQVNDGAPALIGSIRFDQDRRPRNSLFAVLDKGVIAAVYDKWHLVPFGEYIPGWLPLPIMVMPGGGLAPGPGPQTLHLPGLPAVGPLICYEAIFTGEIIDRADRPDWLVNITNDAWFGNSTGPRQHLAAARMRAVEEGLPLLRAANTGISAAFDAHGHELGRIGMQTSGSLSVTLPGVLPPTLYARLGLWVPALGGFVTLGIGLTARRIASPIGYNPPFG
jgi:apolipoprotein N-acyltransferase